MPKSMPFSPFDDPRLEPLESRLLLDAALEIVSHSPQGPEAEPIPSIEVMFNQAIDSSTFTAEDVVLAAPPAHLGQADTPGGDASDVELVGDLAYVAVEGDSGSLRIFDVSDPENPVARGVYAASGNYGIKQVEIVGSTAYVMHWGSGVSAIDVSDPDNPTEIDTWTDVPYPNAIAAGDGYVYVGIHGQYNSNKQLVALEVQPDGSLTEVDRIQVGRNPHKTWALDNIALDLANDRAIVSVAKHIYAVDISDPSELDRIGSGGYQKSGWSSWGVFSVAAEGDYAYVTSSPGMDIVEMSFGSDSVSFSAAGSVSLDTWAYDARLFGDRLYLGNSTAGVTVIDVADPDAPAFVTSLSHEGSSWGVATDGQIAVSAAYDAGMQVMSLAALGFSPTLGDYDPQWPDLPGSTGQNPTVHRVMKATPYGDYAVLARHSSVQGATSIDPVGRLEILDVSNPTAPTRVGLLEVAGAGFTDVEIVGSRAYVAMTGVGMGIVSLADPTHPVLLGQCDVPPAAGLANLTFTDIEVASDYAYLASYNQGLVVVDISDETDPTVAGRLDNSDSNIEFSVAKALAVEGDYAYVAGMDAAMTVVDISDPSDPTWVTEFGPVSSAPGVSIAEVAVVDGRAYLCEKGFGMRIVDVSDPTSPSLLGTYSPRLGEEADSIFVRGHLAYVADYSGGLRIADVSTPSAPVELASISLSAAPASVRLAGPMAYLARAGSGFSLAALHPAGIRHVDATTHEIVLGFAMPDALRSVQVGPHIATPGGEKMNGDGDASIGEPVDDAYAFLLRAAFANPAGDLNASGTVEGNDIDLLLREIAKDPAEQDLSMDLTDDGLLTSADADVLVGELVYVNGDLNTPGSEFGDANLDGNVDVTDLAILAANWNGTDEAWDGADFNGDQAVDVTDLAILAANWNYTRPTTKSEATVGVLGLVEIAPAGEADAEVVIAFQNAPAAAATDVGPAGLAPLSTGQAKSPAGPAIATIADAPSLPDDPGLAWLLPAGAGPVVAASTRSVPLPLPAPEVDVDVLLPATFGAADAAIDDAGETEARLDVLNLLT
jgi:hypothetical protein